jgi:fatty-acyl-CoA synthase
MPVFDTIWLAVLDHPRFAEADLTALRTLLLLGGPEALAAAQARIPHVAQVSGTGSTEAGGNLALGSALDPPAKRTTTCGRLMSGMEASIVAPVTGAPCPPGEVGELLIRGRGRFLGYYKEPEATAAVIDDEGWYHSGDLASIDADGYVTYIGREKDTLKVGGENVAPREVEDFLARHPAVAIAAVIGAPDARYTEVPAAYVELAPGATATEEELIAFCIDEIATFKVPRYVRFVTEWPMSGTKIEKRTLRERLAEELRAAGITEAPPVRPPGPRSPRR